MPGFAASDALGSGDRVPRRRIVTTTVPSHFIPSLENPVSHCLEIAGDNVAVSVLFGELKGDGRQLFLDMRQDVANLGAREEPAAAGMLTDRMGFDPPDASGREPFLLRHPLLPSNAANRSR